MAELLFSPDADQQLTLLESDTTRRHLYERVNDVLDAIEDDPSNPSVRQRRYQSPPVWGVTVEGSGDAWLVLWSESDKGALVHYIGEDLR